MPAFLTHRAATERVREALGKGVISNKGAFDLGGQGPDILFFRNYMPWRSAKDSLPLGIEMHRDKARALFEKGLEFARCYGRKDKDELISYVAGFITHYAIDKNAHPFVYDKSRDDSNVHHKLEFMWDSYTAKEQWDIEPDEFDIYRDVMYDTVGRGPCEWYRAVAKDVYGRNIGPRVIRQAQYHFAKAKKSLDSVKWPGRMLMNVISRITGFDVGTMIYPQSRDESLFTTEEYSRMRKMIDRGVGESAEMIRVAFDYIHSNSPAELPEWFGDTNFAGLVQHT